MGHSRPPFRVVPAMRGADDAESRARAKPSCGVCRTWNGTTSTDHGACKRKDATMNLKGATAALVLGFTGLIAPALAAGSVHQDPMVGGAAMYPSKDIVDNAVQSADHTTLVTAVKAAGLVDTLKS